MTGTVRFEYSRGGSFNLPRDWTAFEQLTRDLFARLLDNDHVDLNGRNGQAQSGVDVWGVDRNANRRVGVQCKGRTAGYGAHLTEKELREEVERAKSFVPALDRFVLLTTGPNDARLKRVAAELSDSHNAENLFTVEFHGWDWIEGKLDQHKDIAARYGLIAVAYPIAPTAQAGSRIAVAIGKRLEQAIGLMNAGRQGDKCFTPQSLARRAGHRDWRRIEQILDGSADADEAELISLCEALGLNPDWLLEGKLSPFWVDHSPSFLDVETLFETIFAMDPKRIVFVRQREGGEGHHDVFVAVERDETRWFMVRDQRPGCGNVGSGGAYDLLELCRLMRRLDNLGPDTRILCHGKHFDNPTFDQLIDGDVYPGAVIDDLWHDRWWEALAHLRVDWVEGKGAHWDGLRDAIQVVKERLARARKSAKTSEHWEDKLRWGHFLPTKPEDADRAGEPYP